MEILSQTHQLRVTLEMFIGRVNKVNVNPGRNAHFVTFWGLKCVVQRLVLPGTKHVF